MSSPTTPARRGAGDAGVLGWVAAGGAVGALLRWDLELLTPVGAVLPWSTLLVNVLGSAALAWLLVRDERRPAKKPARAPLFLVIWAALENAWGRTGPRRSLPAGPSMGKGRGS